MQSSKQGSKYCFVRLLGSECLVDQSAGTAQEQRLYPPYACTPRSQHKSSAPP